MDFIIFYFVNSFQSKIKSFLNQIKFGKLFKIFLNFWKPNFEFFPQ